MKQPALTFYGGKFMALVPVAIYTFFCLLLFVFYRAFNMEALAVGGFLALLIGGIFARSYRQFWEAATRGISSLPSVSVIMILLMVGMFSALIKLCGLSNGFVWLATALGVHGGLFVAFTFLATCVVSTATGSSIGTMFIAFPIFYAAGGQLGANEMMLAGSIVSGAIFGDNLAPISDTTIASASTQQFQNGQPADIGGVVRSRFKYSAVAASVTLVIYIMLGGVGGHFQGGKLAQAASPAPLIMLLPVAVMLVVAVKTRNIYAGLLVGLGLGTVTGLAFGLFKSSAIFANHAAENKITGFLVTGLNDILPTVALVIAVFGIMGVLTEAGVLDDLAQQVLRHPLGKTARGTELIAMLGISLVTIIFGGVTSAAILTAGPIVNKIGQAHQLHPYRRANLLDGTANSLPALVPFLSVFIFIGAALTKLSPVTVALGTIYGIVLFGVYLVAVVTGWGRRLEAPQEVESRN